MRNRNVDGQRPNGNGQVAEHYQENNNDDLGLANKRVQIWGALKEKAKVSIIGAVFTVVVVMFIIMIDKIGDYQKHAVPVVWKGRIREISREAAKKLEIAKRYSVRGPQQNLRMSYHNIVQASNLLEAVKRLVGGPSLPKIAGMNTTQLEIDIRELYDAITDKIDGGEEREKWKSYAAKDRDTLSIERGITTDDMGRPSIVLDDANNI